jgi:hypothetical protein
VYGILVLMLRVDISLSLLFPLVFLLALSLSRSLSRSSTLVTLYREHTVTCFMCAFTHICRYLVISSCSLVRLDPIRCMVLLPVVLFRIGVEESAEVLWDLLSQVVLLAAEPTCVGPVLRQVCFPSQCVCW